MVRIVIADKKVTLGTVGARGEGILDVVRRQGLGGCPNNANDAQALEYFTIYAIGLVSDSVLDQANDAKDAAEEAASTTIGSLSFGTFIAAGSETTIDVGEDVDLAGTLHFFRGNERQIPGVDYTSDGSGTITIADAAFAGEKFWWLHGGGLVSADLFTGGVTVTPNGQDQTTELQAILDAGKVGRMKPGGTYYISSRLTWSAPDSGFVGAVEGPRWNVVMLSDTGEFDLAAPSNSFPTNGVGFYALNMTRPVLKGVHISLETNAGNRSAVAAAFRACTDADVEVTLSGFKEASCGYVAVDSAVRGTYAVKGWDCGSSSTGAGSFDPTLLQFDDNKIASVMSYGFTVPWAMARDIKLTGSALAAYGAQGQALRITTDGDTGAYVGLVEAINCGQGLDLWGDNAIIEAVHFKNIDYFPCKLIYGASYNRIKSVVGDSTGLAVVAISGDNNALRTKNCVGNYISGVKATNVGKLHTSGHPASAFAAQCGVSIDGGGGAWLHHEPSDNIIEGYVEGYNDGSTTHMRAVCGTFNGAGSGNTFRGNGKTYALRYADTQTSAQPPILLRDIKAYVQAYCSTPTVTDNGDEIPCDTVVTDTYGNYNTSEARFTADGPMTVIVRAGCRVQALPDDAQIGIQIWKTDTGGTPAQQLMCRMGVNDSGADRNGFGFGARMVDLKATESISIFFDAESGGSPLDGLTLADGLEQTWVEIREL